MSEPREERLERIAANLMELHLYPERWGNENLRTLHLKVIEEAHFEIKRLAQIERQVRELRGKWRETAREFLRGAAAEELERCADELSAIIDAPEEQ